MLWPINIFYPMKLLFVLVTALFSHVANAQFNTNVYWTQQTTLSANNIIYYSSSKPLNWKDFQGAPVESSKATAITASGFGYKADIKNKGSVGQLNVGVYCFFNKNNSWVKVGKSTDYILSHEQHHFNISFIAANYFIDKLKSTEFSSTNYNVLLARLYKESCDYMNRMQDDYDGQTKNGQLKDVQGKWNDFISQKVASFTR